ncbi:MAG TPA: PDZ domain-containing protein [Candidatus Andersenbacteria bacterium]|nr:PDZ domain-containing protein [Candidatus Andersenbacteria bacterium]
METQSTTIKVSLPFLILLIILLACVGGLGGYIGARIVVPRYSMPASSSSDSNTIVPVTQQITVSPSKLATDTVATKSKSIFLLAHQTAKGLKPFAMGVAVTNDGVIISTQDGGSDPVIAVGEDATSTPITTLGTDTLTGLHFFRLDHTVVTPIDVSQANPKIGATMLALFRSSMTMASASEATYLSELIPAPQNSAPGLQQAGLIQQVSPALPAGTALLDDEGRLAALVETGENTEIILSSDIQEAISRLSSGSLTNNPFTDVGFTIAWTLQQNNESVFAVRAVAQSVTPKNIASDAGLKNGDIITAINGNAITWDSSIIKLLTNNQIQLSIMRNNEPLTITISKQAS